MLTKSVNKVYLLSYNACEAWTFPVLKLDFEIYRKILASTVSSYQDFDLFSD